MMKRLIILGIWGMSLTVPMNGQVSGNTVATMEISTEMMHSFVEERTYMLVPDEIKKMHSVLDFVKLIPELKISSTGEVEMKSGETVKLLVNGTSVTEEIMRKMNKNSVVRIDYYSQPPLDIKAAGVSVVVNIITKKVPLSEMKTKNINLLEEEMASF